LTLFYRYFKPLIEAGYIYIAQPPLYRIQSGKRVEYAYFDEERDEIVSSMKKGGVVKTKVEGKKIKGKMTKEENEGAEELEKVVGINIQRYKGLGEMNPEQLWDTTMNPANRVLRQVNIEDNKESDKIFDVLMGEEVMPRRKFIQTHAKNVKNLDI
jgi:DNA gyrase subunit B